MTGVFQGIAVNFFLKCARFLGFNEVCLYAPNGDEGNVLAIHFARDEIVLERSIEELYLERNK